MQMQREKGAADTECSNDRMAHSQTRCNKARKKFNFNGGGPQKAAGMPEHSPSHDPRHKVAFRAITRGMEGRRMIVLSQRDTFLRIKGALYTFIVRESGPPSLCVYIGDKGNYVGRATLFRAWKS